MSNQFDQLLQTNVLILSKFSLELGEKKTALIFESAELATSLENWESLIEIFSLSDENTKEKVIEDFCFHFVSLKYLFTSEMMRFSSYQQNFLRGIFCLR